MPTMTHNRMNHERVAELIEAYGSNTQRWPEQERAAAIACLESSVALQQLLHEAEQLDMALQAGHVEDDVDEAFLVRVVDQLPAQPATGKDVSKPHRHYQWPAAMAAAISAVAIMLVVMNGPVPESQGEQLALQDIDYWFWQEVTGQESFDDEEEPITDFLSMI
jgi:hypothetical protein